MGATTTIPSGLRSALIASPSRQLREQVQRSLAGRCARVQLVPGGADALAKLEEGDWQILYLDRRLPDLDCEELIAVIQKRYPTVQTLVLDSNAALPDDAPENKAGGAVRVVGEARDQQCDRNNGEEHNGDCDESWRSPRNPAEFPCPPLPGMIGRSETMQRIYHLAKLVAPRTTTVLIVGPTGSGKELVARALHALSPRCGKPFVAVNCAAIPETLLESELFGHARGAFTGAVQAQIGRIPAAHGGTIFLDEVGELPLSLQAKLLRFLEEKEVQRLGSAELTRVDVRVIAASNVDMAERAGRGEFREDLFYRLAAFPLELPPLSERRSDIVPLAEHFLACMAAAMNMPCPRLSAEAAKILEEHPWRGNVRELQHVMERASILVEDRDTVLSEHLYFPFQQTSHGARPALFARRSG
jgi:DNA-binding NtrC family response regulator